MINYNTYPQYGMQLANQAPQPNYLKGRLVSSIDEARVAQIDFDGSLFIFPDLANKKIYTKQVGMDGTAILNSYSLEKMPDPAPQPSYVTQEELEKAINELKETLSTKQKVVLDI